MFLSLTLGDSLSGMGSATGSAGRGGGSKAVIGRARQGNVFAVPDAADSTRLAAY